MLKKIVFVVLLTGCAAKPAPELDPVKVQKAFLVIGEHIESLDKRVSELEKK
jgi:hypothetical protein